MAVTEKKTYKSSQKNPAGGGRVKGTFEVTLNPRSFGSGDQIEGLGRELEYFLGDYGTDWTVELAEVDA